MELTILGEERNHQQMNGCESEHQTVVRVNNTEGQGRIMKGGYIIGWSESASRQVASEHVEYSRQRFQGSKHNSAMGKGLVSSRKSEGADGSKGGKKDRDLVGLDPCRPREGLWSSVQVGWEL